MPTGQEETERTCSAGIGYCIQTTFGTQDLTGLWEFHEMRQDLGKCTAVRRRAPLAD